MTSQATNASEGFDLDAIPASSEGDIIYELGGGATSTGPPTRNDEGTSYAAAGPAAAQDPKEIKVTKSDSNGERSPCPTQKSEEYKAKGNEQFKQGNFLDAIDYYTDAIDACPGMTGEEMLQLKSTHEEEEREKTTKRYNRDADRRMAKSKSKFKKEKNEGCCGNDGDGDKDKDEDRKEKENEDELASKEFEPPIHPHGKQLAVYYSNRAACFIQLQKYNDAIQDCNIATLVCPSYVKAYTRRMTCYEHTERTEEALRDAKQAMEVSPGNKEIQKHVKRLQKLEDERMEKLKEETMGKLKDLGNSILGNFGMSLDNFKAEKDPNTGSYSISFNK